MMKILKQIAITLIMLLQYSGLLLGEPEIIVMNNYPGNYPVVKTEALILDSAYFPYLNISKEDITLKYMTGSKAGSELSVIDLTGNNGTALEEVSLVVVVDLGLSDSVVFSMAKQAVKSLTSMAMNGKTELGIISFDEESYLNAGLSSEMIDLDETIEGLKQGKRSNYYKGLAGTVVSGIEEAKKGIYKKAIILISDDEVVNGFNMAGDWISDSLMKKLQESEIGFYCLTIGGKTQDEFKEVCDVTGGKYFDGLRDNEEVVKAARGCLSYVYGYQPYEVFYELEEDCEDEVKISIECKEAVPDSIMIDSLEEYHGGLEWYDKTQSNIIELNFGAVIPGEFYDIDVELKAMNKDILISDMWLSSNEFSIIAGGIGSEELLIAENESHFITIRYEAADSTLMYDSLVLGTDGCFGSILMLSAGFGNQEPKKRTIKLENPLCGDTLQAGDTVDIRWSGVLKEDVIQLEYSEDGGENWNLLAEDVRGLSYKWEVPDIETRRLLIRVIQLWPNNVGKTVDLEHNGEVWSVNFSKKGDKGVIASQDEIVSVWRTNLGTGVLYEKDDKELHRLIGHKRGVRWANFSPDGNYVVTASDDTTIRVWNVSNDEEKFSKEILTLRGHTAEVKSANYSPDGKFIVSASWDGKVKLWDALSGKFIKNIQEEYFRLWYAEFSPDGNYLVTSGNSNRIKIWVKDSVDSTEWTLYRNLFLMNNPVIHASFSSDSKRLASAGWFGRAVVWDIEKGDTILTVKHPDTTGSIFPINSAVFDKSGKYLLTSSVNTTACIWDSETGELQKTLREHKNSVQHAVFNLDGKKILTAGSDNVAKLWHLDTRVLQMDSCDCEIIIGRALVDAYDIDLGKVALGNTKEYVIDTFLVNNSDFEVKIRNIVITGKDSNDFRIKEIDSYKNIPSLGVKSAVIVFSPKDIGIREAKLEIDIPGLYIVKNIRGEGVRAELFSSYNYIDFDKVELGDYRDTTINMIVKNISEKRLKINDIKVTGPDYRHFYIVEGGDVEWLESGEGINLKLRYMPEEAVRSSAVLLFTYDGIGEERKITLLGEGIKPIVDSIMIIMDSFEGYEGNIYEVPLKIILLNGKEFNPLIESFRVDLKFNATMLQPIFDMIDSRLADKERIVTFDIPLESKNGEGLADSIVHWLKFKVVLGNDTSTALKLSDVKVEGECKTALDIVSGEFRLLGYCKKGGTRLFNSDGKIALAQNKPNPFESSTEIEIEVFESGEIKLYIIDMNGRIVGSVFNGELNPGIHSFVVELPNLASGKYFYILETPTYMISKGMNIKR